LTDESLHTFDANFKMNPPLRTWADVEAVISGLVDGTIEILATDHAPHAPEKKSRELDQAPFGILGLETLLPIVIKGLIEPGHLTWANVIRKLTINPARLLGIPKGTLRAGADADVTLIDPEARWTINPAHFHSKSRNTPFGGWDVRGRAHTVIVSGEVRHTVAASVHPASEGRRV
jgi:dihydroorotase